MRIIQAIFILRHALGWRILLRFGVSKFQEIPGTSRYVADAREFHVRRISRSALCACIRADASRQAFRGAIRISCARVLITNSRVLRGERSYAEKKRKKFYLPPRSISRIAARLCLRFKTVTTKSISDIVSNLFHRYQFFLQIKQDILQGRLPVSFDLAAELGAYVVQCEISSEKTRIGRARCLLFLVHTVHLNVVRLMKKETGREKSRERSAICTVRSEYENLCTHALCVHMYSVKKRV